MTVLWTTYLTLMVYLTINTIVYIISQLTDNLTEEEVKWIPKKVLVVACMWSIWYMYFLH